MSYISGFMLCDSINNASPQPNANIQSLVGPQTVLRPIFIPSVFSFGIAVGISDVDLTKPTEVQFIIKNPKGDVIQDSGVNTLPVVGDIVDSLPQKYQGFMLTLDIRNLIIETEGEYIFSLFVNGENMGEREIPVFIGKR